MIHTLPPDVGYSEGQYFTTQLLLCRNMQDEKIQDIYSFRDLNQQCFVLNQVCILATKADLRLHHHNCSIQELYQHPITF